MTTTKANVLNLLSTMLKMGDKVEAPVTQQATAAPPETSAGVAMPTFADTEMIPVRQADGRLTNYPPPDKWDDWVE